MEHSGNTMLITGATSGIGRALAEAFHRQGNTVIVTGRRQTALDELTAANPGIAAIACDITDTAALARLADEIKARFPKLNVLCNNAGIMRRERLDVLQPNTDDAEAIVTTNLLAPIRLTGALLPLLRQQASSTIINTTSGLAFVPMAITPTYSASKAGLHAYTRSLRHQLAGSTTQVIELIPPYVATDLLDGANDPNAMPLDEFISETLRLFANDPTPDEICVERVKPLRYAAKNGQDEAIFQRMNSATAVS